MSLRCRVVHAAWRMTIRAEAHRFRRDLSRPREARHAWLRATLTRNADTVFGREHGFAKIRDVEEYRARVPRRDYDDFTPWIERIAGGEDRVLTADRVRLFEPSSGSTRAAKWIPYTASLQAEYRRAVSAWIDDLFATRPELMRGPAYWSITPNVAITGAEQSKIPVGFDEDAAYLGGATQRLVRSILAVPSTLRRIRDTDTFLHATLLHLLGTPELRLISVWHPSFLSLLFAPLDDRTDELLRDLERGFVDEESGIRIPPARRRARELAALARLEPRRLWPHLRLVSAWGDGHASLHLAEIEALLPGVEIQPKGLIATEAFVTLPYRGAHPLAIRSHFFEFVDDGGALHGADELCEGSAYSVVVTTGGGLYRYRLRDRVRVTGFVERTPSLRFLGKEDRVSDLYGEKLSEGFVAGVVDRITATLPSRPRFAMLAPERVGSRHGYVLYLETPDAPTSAIEAELQEELAANPHYAHCVGLSQLQPARIRPVPPGAYARYTDRLVANGTRLGDVKPTPLSTQEGWDEVLTPSDADR